MRLETRLFRRSILSGHLTLPTRSPFTTSHTVRSSQQEQATSLGATKSHNGRNGGPQRGSIRPLTVLLLCIPLGYGVRWTLETQDDSRSSKSADGFIEYTLTNKERVSSTSSIFTLKPTTSTTISTDDISLKRAITSVQFKQPQLQIARNYTLLPPSPEQSADELRFLIREERKGEVSGYLHRLAVGSEVEVRGLSVEYVLPEKVETVLFLAGGTGIVPAMQVAGALAGEADVHILWGNRKREDCVGGRSDTVRVRKSTWGFSGWWSPFGLPSANLGRSNGVEPTEKSAVVSQLDSLKRSSSQSAPNSTSRALLVDYYVDEEGTLIQPADVSRLLQKSSNKSTNSTDPKSKVLFVSGPDGFVSHWAGPKQWDDGREVQGPLGGVLSKLQLRGWKVVKL